MAIALLLFYFFYPEISNTYIKFVTNIVRNLLLLPKSFNMEILTKDYHLIKRQKLMEYKSINISFKTPNRQKPMRIISRSL